MPVTSEARDSLTMAPCTCRHLAHSAACYPTLDMPAMHRWRPGPVFMLAWSFPWLSCLVLHVSLVAPE